MTLIDIFGTQTINNQKRYMYKNDADAIASDWLKIGDDFWNSKQEMDKELSEQYPDLAEVIEKKYNNNKERFDQIARKLIDLLETIPDAKKIK